MKTSKRSSNPSLLFGVERAAAGQKSPEIGQGSHKVIKPNRERGLVSYLSRKEGKGEAVGCVPRRTVKGWEKVDSEPGKGSAKNPRERKKDKKTGKKALYLSRRIGENSTAENPICNGPKNITSVSTRIGGRKKEFQFCDVALRGGGILGIFPLAYKKNMENPNPGPTNY